ncbi:amidase [Nocardia sp. NPDC057353]|uniref:amidase n=1 Tax=Nocardia sp. NPDC057353 TaxID=3346104 RepID=UPI003643270E
MEGTAHRKDTMEIAELDATAQAELVHTGQATPADLVRAAIEAVERLDPQLDTVLTRTFEYALEQARTVAKDAPFPGVPMLLKDYHLQLAGYPFSHGGVPLLRDHVSDTTTYLAESLRDAGFAFLGRSRTPLMGVVMGTHDPEVKTMPRNPWNPEYSTGASSSGSAAAVAAHLVPLAHGNDGGGSLRMPAALNGVVALKATRGRISLGPHAGPTMAVDLSWGEEFVLTRSVRDSAALLPLVEGRRPGDPFPPVRAETSGVQGPLRIGLATTPPLAGIETDPQNARAAEEAATALAELGHTVVPVQPPRYDIGAHNWQYGIPASPALIGLARTLDTIGALVGRPVTQRDVGPVVWAIAELGGAFTGTMALEFAEYHQSVVVGWDRWWDEQRLDVLLTPTTARRTPPMTDFLPPPHGTFQVDWETPVNNAGALAQLTPLIAYTQIYNWSGQPAVNLPLGVDDDGLPLGVQLGGRRLREDQLLDLAAALEVARPWAGRRPRIRAGQPGGGAASSAERM